MIETLVGENGHPVIRQDGRLLASRFDPVSEARAWLGRRRDFVDKVKTIFVLGLGSGYHVQALVENTSAHIVVIEPDLQLIEAVTQIHQFAAGRVTIEPVQTARGLRASQAVRNAVKTSFTVLSHPPSNGANAQFFKDCQAQLTGRDWGSLTWQWQIKNGPALDSTPRAGGSGTLTIYDLEQTELVQNSEERERLLVKALRELVK